AVRRLSKGCWGSRKRGAGAEPPHAAGRARPGGSLCAGAWAARLGLAVAPAVGPKPPGRVALAPRRRRVPEPPAAAVARAEFVRGRERRGRGPRRRPPPPRARP